MVAVTGDAMDEIWPCKQAAQQSVTLKSSSEVKDRRLGCSRISYMGFGITKGYDRREVGQRDSK